MNPNVPNDVLLRELRDGVPAQKSRADQLAQRRRRRHSEPPEGTGLEGRRCGAHKPGDVAVLNGGAHRRLVTTTAATSLIGSTTATRTALNA